MGVCVRAWAGGARQRANATFIFCCCSAVTLTTPPFARASERALLPALDVAFLPVASWTTLPSGVGSFLACTFSFFTSFLASFSCFLISCLLATELSRRPSKMPLGFFLHSM